MFRFSLTKPMIPRHDGHLRTASVAAHETIEYRQSVGKRTGNQDPRALIAQDMLDGIIIRPGFKLMQLIPMELACVEQPPLLLADALRDRPTFDFSSDAKERVFQESCLFDLFFGQPLGKVDFPLVSLHTGLN